MLRGRGRELDHVSRLLRDVRGGGHRALIVDGEAGIGKTRLVTEAVTAAAAEGFRTFVGAAEPAERGKPFAAVFRLLGLNGASSDPLAGEIGGLLASVGRSRAEQRWVDPGVDVGFWVTDAIVDLLERDASSGPVLIVLDDLHWADRASTEVLDSVHHRLADLPIALLITMRTGESSAQANELLSRLAAGSRVLSLAPLADDAVLALVGDLTGARVGARLRRQLARAEGNPFFVTELVRALGDEGMLTVEAGVAESSATTVPSGLVHTVLRRLHLLPGETFELLRFASILGQSFSVADLARVARRNTVELVRQLVPALCNHTLRGSDDQLAFGHALTWEAVYHDLPAAVRRAVHRETAAVLAEAGVPPVRVVRHFMLGAEFGDTEAIAWLRKTARGVAPSSPATAAELLGKAVELAADAHDLDSIVAELAPLLVVIGEVAQAKELTNAALSRGVDPGVEARLRAGLTHVLMRRGRVGDAKVQAIKLLELVPPEARELVKGIAGFVLVTAGDADRAEELAEQALVAGEAAGHDIVVATALMTLTWAYGAHGRIQDAVSAGRRAVAATENCKATMSGLLFPHCPFGAALLQADRFPEAEAAFRDGLTRAERTAAPGTLVYHHAGLAATKFLCGDWDAALAEAEVALDLVGKTGTSWMLLPSAVIARIAVARDELATAETVLNKALRAPEAGYSTMTLDWVHWAHAVLMQAAGAPDRAVVAVERAWRAVPAMHDVIGNRIAPVDYVRIALSAGNRALAEEITGELARMAARSPMASLRATALHCRGLLAGDGDALSEALALLRNTARRYQWAMVNEDAAVGLGAADPSVARTLFRAALSGYRELGAVRDIARVSAAMRAIGLRPGGARPSGNVLTQAERTVAGLVAEGLSNPQIAQRLYISRHTAETHMKHIFAKLGLTSRAELAAIVARGLVAR